MTEWSPSRRAVLGSLATAGAAGTVTGCLGLGGPRPKQQVESHRDVLTRYADVATTVEDGYRTAATYVQTETGALGEPLINFDAPTLDPATPQVVFYRLDADGQYVPLGLKWYVKADEADSPPSLFGKSFRGPIESDVPFIPRHYALHVWLFEDNPAGLFARYHTAAEPPPYLDSLRTARGTLSELATGREAKNAGYRNTEQCISTNGGAYGVPFVPKDGGEPGGTTLTDPPILRYHVTENWTYVLWGAEWYVPAAEANSSPSLFGQPFHEPMAGHSKQTDQPEHYGLHAWLYKTNPRGMFEPFNPAAVC